MELIKCHISIDVAQSLENVDLHLVDVLWLQLTSITHVFLKHIADHRECLWIVSELLTHLKDQSLADLVLDSRWIFTGGNRCLPRLAVHIEEAHFLVCWLFFNRRVRHCIAVGLCGYETPMVGLASSGPSGLS